MSENIIRGQAKTNYGENSLALESIKKSILALQHLIAMFGATVLVPMIIGLHPSIALFTAGTGTLIFHAVTGGKVPVFLGSSFAFIPVVLQVSARHGGDLAYAQGGMFVAGLIYIIASFLVKKIGVEKIEKYLAPQVVGPMIIVIGLKLIPTALEMASENYMLALITLAIALLTRYQGRGFIKQLSILIAVVAGYMISLRLNLVDTAAIANSEMLRIPPFRLPKFDPGAVAVIAPVVLAVFMEHLGDITTNGQVVGKNFVEDPGLHRTLLGDGLATTFASLVGGPANTTYGENTGVLAITKNYDPSILRLAAVFAIGLAFIGKVGSILTSIPQAVMGGISMMLFSMIALVGARTLKEEKVKFNLKNTIIIATILILGLGGNYLSNKYGIFIGIRLTQTVAITDISFAAIVGIILNRILNKN